MAKKLSSKTVEEIEKRAATARFTLSVEEARINEQVGIAIRLAPAFRDRFDFSGVPTDHYDQMTDMAFLAADAIMRKRAALLESASKKYQPDIQKAEELGEEDEVNDAAEAKEESK